MLPRYRRATIPPAMRFQDRDGAILTAIYQRDGVLAKRQIKELFWPDASCRAMEMRLSLLYHQGYLDWPTYEQWRTRPIPESICWLGWMGILWIAGQQGINIETPKKTHEAELRRMASQLRSVGIRWVREPRWSLLAHDLSGVDFRLAVEKSIAATPTLELGSWMTEGEFLTNMDEVEFQVADKRGGWKRKIKGVRPDGCFTITDTRRLSMGLPAVARFLIEIDRATHDLDSFSREKVAAGVAYLQSAAYKARFGDNAGRWLVLTTGQARMKHLLECTRTVLRSNTDVFLFSTLENITTGNILTRPMWWSVDMQQPMALFAN